MDPPDDLPADKPPLQPFSGTCSLVFEGHEFTPGSDRGSEPTLWLDVSEDVRSELARFMGIDEAALSLPGGFYAEFMGRVYWSAIGTGHFGMYPGTVVIERVISARAPAASKRAGKPRSIRAVLTFGAGRGA